jgi:hypothetical protein
MCEKSVCVCTRLPGEEAALEQLLLGLGPPQHTLEEAGQLCELLVMLGHSADAAKLQQRVGAWQAAAAEAAQAVAAGRAGAAAQQAQQAGGGVSAAQPPAAAAAAAAAAGAATAAVVHWKWDVLRQHKP